MEVKEDIGEIRDKLFNKLIGTGWEAYLRLMVRSQDFDEILKKLKKEVENDFRFSPPLNDIFKPFTLCHAKDLKVVFLVKEPYLYVKKADGLAFSYSHESKPHHTQNHIFQEISRAYPEKPYTHGQDLSDWAMQGILLYNCCLTTRLSERGKHENIWKGFTRYVLEKIIQQNPDVIFVLFGDVYDMYDKFIPDTMHKLYVSCPMESISFGKNKGWNSNNIFLEINNILEKQGKQKIIW